ncbi:hypothetical protein N9955_00315 [bacterium]|nr:hypothetical protein [bacterium]
MPYIPKEDRPRLQTDVVPLNSGELNYAIHMLITNYVKEHGLRYSTCNDIGGALINVHAEFYRRLAGDYEDIKKEENGDIDIYER